MYAVAYDMIKMHFGIVVFLSNIKTLLTLLQFTQVYLVVGVNY